MKNLINLFVIVIFTFILTACDNAKSTKTIGIIVPMEHEAMTEIVAGFTETLKANYKEPVKFKIANAQGDINLQRAIIQQMKDSSVNIVVPIATGTTEMTDAMITNKPIVSLATTMTDADRKKQKVCNIVVVHDEIPVEKQIAFIHAIYPNLNKIVLIHSTDDKIFAQVKTAVDVGKKNNITIQPLMISTLSELYSVANSIPSDTQGIFVLKDSLIVSGIATLTKVAHDNKIPLITSDEGSVTNGADLALGVPEREIGANGAILAAKVLQGANPCQLQNIDMTDLTIFINKNANLDLEKIKSVAVSNHYQVKMI